jgi:hypothetical protein
MLLGKFLLLWIAATVAFNAGQELGEGGETPEGKSRLIKIN